MIRDKQYGKMQSDLALPRGQIIDGTQIFYYLFVA